MATENKGKAKEANAAPAATDAAPAVDMTQFGQAVATRKTAKVNPFENIPSFVPGKNLEPGRLLAGFYVRTKRVWSEKLTAGKKDPRSGKRYRDLHILKDATTSARFGIWSVGQLGAVLPFLKRDQYVTIEYLGIAAKSIRPGQSPAHDFNITAEGEVDIDHSALDEDTEDFAGEGDARAAG